MTAIENAIRDARDKGGYVTSWAVTKDEIILSLATEAMILLDPAFWQALGKARGWTDVLADFPRWERYESPIKYSFPGPAWQQRMLDFTYHLAEGKDAESFFATLE